MFLVNQNIPILLQTYLLSPHVYLSNAGFHLYPWAMVLSTGQAHVKTTVHIWCLYGETPQLDILFSKYFHYDVYSCFLLANNQNYNTLTPAITMPSCLYSAVKSWNFTCQEKGLCTSPNSAPPQKKKKKSQYSCFLTFLWGMPKKCNSFLYTSPKGHLHWYYVPCFMLLYEESFKKDIPFFNKRTRGGNAGHSSF